MKWLTSERKKELQAIMLEDYGRSMTDAEAEEFGESVIEWFSIALKDELNGQ